MKKIYALLLLITAPLLITAQITITSADLPTAGSTFVNANDTNYSAAITPGGFQSWNYSSLQNHVQDTTAFIPAAGTQGASLFPNANLAVFDPSLGSYTYFIANSTGFYINGGTSAGPLGGLLAYNPPLSFVHTPLTYNDSYSDYARVQIDSGSAPAIRFIHHVANNVTCDGYGSLQLPNAFYPDVIRVKTIETSTDSIMYDLAGTGNYVMFGNPTVSQVTHYRWLRNGAAAFVLGIDADSLGTTGTHANYLLNYTVGLPSLSSNDFTMQVSPNPAVDKAHIVFPEPVQNALLTVTDAQGKLAEEITVQKNDVWLDVSRYNKGWYFISLKNGSSIHHAKLLVVGADK